MGVRRSVAETNTVWAVLNHGGRFAVSVVPEPASAGWPPIGALALLRRRNRTARSASR